MFTDYWDTHIHLEVCSQSSLPAEMLANSVRDIVDLSEGLSVELKAHTSRGSRERYDVPDIGQPCHKLNKALKTESKSRVGNGTELS